MIGRSASISSTMKSKNAATRGVRRMCRVDEHAPDARLKGGRSARRRRSDGLDTQR
jgi:hypothetical protein